MAVTHHFPTFVVSGTTPTFRWGWCTAGDGMLEVRASNGQRKVTQVGSWPDHALGVLARMLLMELYGRPWE